jgi:hypothetical protein
LKQNAIRERKKIVSTKKKSKSKEELNYNSSACIRQEAMQELIETLIPNLQNVMY